MVLAVAAFIGGCVLLIKGAGAMVSGASSLAKRWGVSPLVVGLTVVSLGTTAPELVVNILSVTSGVTELAVGNILGSNLVNLLLILGLTASVRAVRVRSATISAEIPFMLLAAVMVLVMASDIALDGSTSNVLSRTNGLTLLGFFAIYLYYIYQRVEHHTTITVTTHSGFASWGLIALGIVGLVVGGELIVKSTVALAFALGVPQSLVALTIVAVGTSLPELATALVAARRGSVDLAVGNLVGANIYNSFFVLGLTALLAPLPFTSAHLVDLGIFALASVLVFLSVFLSRPRMIRRWQGTVFVLLYLGYVLYTVLYYTPL